VLARATLNGLAGRVVARGLPVAHPCARTLTSGMSGLADARVRLFFLFGQSERTLVLFSLVKSERALVLLHFSSFF